MAEKAAPGVEKAAYPKWKYSKDASGFRSTFVGNAQAEKELGDAWTDDPHAHGIEVVPSGGPADASGKVGFGPAPMAPGVTKAKVGT